MSQLRQTGRVKWFKSDKGFGFIEVIDGDDVFLHKSQVSFEVQEGDKVTFSVKAGKKGPVATDVEKSENQ